jgi:type IV pilus assembly protein PilV
VICRRQPSWCAPEREAGFSMVEVMVALIVISVGLLGIAKMQALALSSTNTAKMRSLASIQAASLASTMRADRAYWATLTDTVTVNVTNKTITAATDPALMAPPSSHCAVVAAIPCTSAQIAAQDLSDWVAALGATLPNDTAVITCNLDRAGANPITCTIQLSWSENVVSSRSAGNASNTAAPQTQYALYVEP